MQLELDLKKTRDRDLYVKGSDLEKPLATVKVEYGSESENGSRKTNEIT